MRFTTANQRLLLTEFAAWAGILEEFRRISGFLVATYAENSINLQPTTIQNRITPSVPASQAGIRPRHLFLRIPMSSTPHIFECLEVSGADRARFLHNLCTNHILGLAEGNVSEAFFCDARARIIAHGWILATAEVHYIILLGASAEALRRHLDRYLITEQVTLNCSTRPLHLLPRSAAPGFAQSESSEPLTGGAAPDGSAFWVNLTWNDQQLLLLSADRQDSDWSSDCLTDDKVNAIRIAAGIPVIGVDLTDEHLAPESDRTSTAISYNKGCYLGQEPIARIDAMGHVNRRLCKVSISGGSTPAISPGSDISDNAGNSLGTLTSVVSPSDTATVGLAVLKISQLEADMQIQSDNQSTHRVTVVD